MSQPLQTDRPKDDRHAPQTNSVGPSASDTESTMETGVGGFSQPITMALPPVGDRLNRGTGPSRQATVLRMQQQFGNRAVQRMIARTIVQRDDDPPTPDAGVSSSSSGGSPDNTPVSGPTPDTAQSAVAPPTSQPADGGAGAVPGAADGSAAANSAGADPSAAGGGFLGSRADKMLWDGVNSIPFVGPMVTAGVDTAAGAYDYATGDSEMGSKRLDSAVGDLKALNPLVAAANMYQDSQGNLGDRVDPTAQPDGKSLSNRLNNATWDAVGFIPGVGNIASGISAGLDGAGALVRSGQSAYNTAIGDEKTAKIREDQAAANGVSAAVDLTGMIPGWGNLQSGAQVVDDLIGPSGSSSQDVADLAKSADWRNPFGQEKMQDDGIRLRKKSGVGLPQDAEFSQDQVGKDSITLTTNGKQHTYVWDVQQGRYVQSS